jgi:hypothetical protein
MLKTQYLFFNESFTPAIINIIHNLFPIGIVFCSAFLVVAAHPCLSLILLLFLLFHDCLLLEG